MTRDECRKCQWWDMKRINRADWCYWHYSVPEVCLYDKETTNDKR